MPLGSTEEVFTTAGTILGERLARVSAGETGERSNWIHWQSAIFQNHPLFAPALPADQAAYSTGAHVKLRPGVTAAEVACTDLGYARVAQSSFTKLSQLKQALLEGSGFRVTRVESLPGRPDRHHRGRAHRQQSRLTSVST